MGKDIEGLNEQFKTLQENANDSKKSDKIMEALELSLEQ